MSADDCCHCLCEERSGWWDERKWNSVSRERFLVLEIEDAVVCGLVEGIIFVFLSMSIHELEYVTKKDPCHSRHSYPCTSPASTR